VATIRRVRDDGVRHSGSGLTTGQVLLVVVEVMRVQLYDVAQVK
jgi:hypothetical protein